MANWIITVAILKGDVNIETGSFEISPRGDVFSPKPRGVFFTLYDGNVVAHWRSDVDVEESLSFCDNVVGGSI